jgi:predicted SAM-dependent methyltransferase
LERNGEEAELYGGNVSVLKIDIGCGGRGSRQKGFVGIDIWPRPKGKTKEEYFQLDYIRDKLPWTTASVDEAIALHMIEHLDLDEGQILFKRTVKLLKKGATFIVTCPDLRLLASAYVNDDSEFLHRKHLRGGKYIWPGDTLADRLNHAIHQAGHKWLYDLESLVYHAERAVGGLVDIIPLPLGHKRWTRPDHETGIVLTKR